MNKFLILEEMELLKEIKSLADKWGIELPEKESWVEAAQKIWDRIPRKQNTPPEARDGYYNPYWGLKLWLTYALLVGDTTSANFFAEELNWTSNFSGEFFGIYNNRTKPDETVEVRNKECREFLYVGEVRVEGPHYLVKIDLTGTGEYPFSLVPPERINCEVEIILSIFEEWII